ncbi:MAG TPA: hypothetical protein VL049_25150, partial [Candidatus Dormibacteraeota bacterium]|nr:hypothetical protein [Candidatus Dormibacteraeota bacterium]
MRITELIQLNPDQDPVPPSLGDFFAEVTINGVTRDNRDDECDNPPPQGFIVPFPMFTEDGFVDSSCRNVPWTFTADVPLSDLLHHPDGIEVRIKIIDDDLVFDDEVEDIDLGVPLGGRWMGTVDWPEHCNHAVFPNGARVCWQIELGQDSDGDGLFDDWEEHGIDVDGDGTIDLDLPAMGANPMHKDLFVELDWRPGSEPRRAEVAQWIAAFAAAPVDAGGIPNPDGLPGINLHIDTGALTENGVLVGENLGGGNPLPADMPICSMAELYPAKATNFDGARRSLAFRYGITSTQCCLSGPDFGKECFIDAQCPSSACTSSGGQAEIGGNDFVVWNTQFQGSSLMHELGHDLELRHGGGNSDNCKPNYMSVMNYDHFEIQRLDGSSIIDYSPPRQPNGQRGTAPLDDLAEDSLDESKVLDPADPQSLLAYTDGTGKKRLSLVGAPVDWSGDGDTADSMLTVNIDNSDSTTHVPKNCTNTTINPQLTGYDDWLNVSLPFLQFGESASGPINPVDTPEPTDAEILGNLQDQNTADLSIAKSGDPGPVEAGGQVDLAYTLDLANLGPNPALMVHVQDTLPPGSAILATDAACAGASGAVSCELPALLPKATGSIDLSLRTTAACVGGLPTAIVNRATIENVAKFAGPDPNPSDNEARFETEVVDTTPPELTLSVSPSTLWPPNHKFVPIMVTAQVSDACDTSPEIR